MVQGCCTLAERLLYRGDGIYSTDKNDFDGNLLFYMNLGNLLIVIFDVLYL